MATLQEIVNQFFGSPYRWVRGFTDSHRGIDLSAPTGTPIKSQTSGRVVVAEKQPSGANVVIVQDNQGYRYWYAHLSSIGVTKNQIVNPGSYLGAVGATGNATGPHLHFAVQNPQRQWVDPVKYLNSGGVILASSNEDKSTTALNFLDKYFKPFIGQTTWGDAVTQIRTTNKVSDTEFIALYHALEFLGINGTTPISEQDYNKVKGWLSIPSNLEGGVSFDFVPDLGGAIMFIGIILVGIAFIILAGLVSKVKTNEA